MSWNWIASAMTCVTRGRRPSLEAGASGGGAEAIKLPGGETRRFLEDDDEVIFRARCELTGATTIGFGECRGRCQKA